MFLHRFHLRHTTKMIIQVQSGINVSVQVQATLPSVTSSFPVFNTIVSNVPVIQVSGGGGSEEIILFVSGSGDFQVTGIDGAVVVKNTQTGLLAPFYTPPTSNSSGSFGQITFDSSHLYVCTADNTWKRADLSTW